MREVQILKNRIEHNNEREDDITHTTRRESIPDEEGVKYENDVCQLEFLKGRGLCKDKKCKLNHNNIDFTKQGVCIIDFERKGSCKRGSRCKFSHQTPTSLREDPRFKEHMQYKKGLCLGYASQIILKKDHAPEDQSVNIPEDESVNRH